jgi:8-oxo-dGTP pyrophosphatase MutT (NUDIX family)
MHRSGALKLLLDHRELPLSREEALAVDETIAFIGSHPDCLLRTCLAGHLTGSAWIVSPDRRRTLLTHHRKLGKWLQLGGHADGDPDLLAVALREAREESGLSRLAVVDSRLFDVDRHWIGSRGAEPGHWHHDLRFMLEADPGEPLTLTGESRALSWVEVASVAGLNPEESMARMVRKTPPARGS